MWLSARCVVLLVVAGVLPPAAALTTSTSTSTLDTTSGVENDTTTSTIPTTQSTAALTTSTSTSTLDTTSGVENNTTTSTSTIPTTQSTAAVACLNPPDIQRGENGGFTSPFYPNKYPDNCNCTWRIITDNNTVVQISFNETFDIEEGSSGQCTDRLVIQDAGASTSQIFCGTQAPADFKTKSNDVIAQFLSDSSVSKIGFALKWQSTQPGWFEWWMLGVILGVLVLIIIAICCCCCKKDTKSKSGETNRGADTDLENKEMHGATHLGPTETNPPHTTEKKMKETDQVKTTHSSIQGEANLGQKTSSKHNKPDDEIVRYHQPASQPVPQTVQGNRPVSAEHTYHCIPADEDTSKNVNDYEFDYNKYDVVESTPIIYEDPTHVSQIDVIYYDDVANEYYNEDLTIQEKGRALYNNLKDQKQGSTRQQSNQGGFPSSEPSVKFNAPLKQPTIKQKVPGVMYLSDAPPDVLPHLHIPRDHLKSVRKLGEGALAVTWEGRWTQYTKPEVVVIKKIKPVGNQREAASARDNMLIELNAVADVTTHPYVLGLLGVNLTKEPDLMVVSFMHLGNLRDYLRKQTEGRAEIFQRVDGAQLLSFAAQCAEGAAHVSNCGVIYGSLAARNVLLNQDDSGQIVCKVADFGFNRTEEMYKSSEEWLLTTRWFAPEVLVRGNHSALSDVWACGILLWEIVSMGRVPFSPKEDHQTSLWAQQVITTSRDHTVIPQPKHCTETLYNLMQSCWKFHEEERIKFTDLVDKLCDLNGSEKTIVKASFSAATMKDEDIYDDIPFNKK